MAKKNDFEKRKRRYFEQRYKSLLLSSNDISIINFEDMSTTDLQDLYLYFRHYGKFQDSLTFKKELAYKRILEKNNLDNFFLAIEAGINPEISSFKRPKSHKLFLSKRVNAQVELYSVLKGEGEKYYRQRERLDKKYFQTLNSSKIIINGPLTLSRTMDKKRQRFDVNITTNKFIKSSGRLENSHSSISISYFNNYRVRERRQEVVAACKELNWSVLKSQKGLNKLSKDLEASSKINLRVLIHDEVFCFVDLMGLQRILLDLLHFPFSEIFISNFSFNSNTGPEYDLNYKHSDIDISLKTILSDMREHDAVANFSFVKYLFQNGFVTCDQTVRSILELEVKDYARILDEKFGL